MLCKHNSRCLISFIFLSVISFILSICPVPISSHFSNLGYNFDLSFSFNIFICTIISLWSFSLLLLSSEANQSLFGAEWNVVSLCLFEGLVSQLPSLLVYIPFLPSSLAFCCFFCLKLKTIGATKVKNNRRHLRFLMCATCGDTLGALESVCVLMVLGKCQKTWAVIHVSFKDSEEKD